MPTYVYETIPADPEQEPERFEMFQKISEAPLTHHPVSNDPVRKIIAGSFAMERRLVNGGVNISRASAGAGACGCATGQAHGLQHNPLKRRQSNGVGSQSHTFGHKHHS